MKYKAITRMKVNVPFILLSYIIALRILLLDTTSLSILSDDLDHDSSFAIPVVKFIWMPAAEINTTRNSLQDRFSVAITIPGTHMYHQFVPTSTSTIKMRRVSNDDGFELEFDFMRDKVSMNCVKVMDVRVAQFLLCKYDDHHWVGTVSEVNEEEHVKIKFMRPNYPSVSYKWPIPDDIWCVPETHQITRRETPITSSVSAR